MKQHVKQGIWKYESQLPKVSEANQITLGEGQVPLIQSIHIGKELGLERLYFKLESLNPTGSYKDRISAMGVSLAKEHNRLACVGTTSGNAGASIAAYAARAGLAYNVFVQENIVESKLDQMIIHQSNIKKVQGFGFSPEIGNRVFAKVLEEANKNDWELLITAYAFAPLAMEAVKTIAYELAEELSEGADAVFVPVGGGGLFTGLFKGFSDLLANKIINELPKIVACQSAGCANVAKAWKLGLNEPVAEESTSRISGIQVPNPPDALHVLQGIRESDGFAEAVEDEQIWYWQERLAVAEGIFCEPAGATALAGVVQALKEGRISADSKVVCIVSGAGYKDAERVRKMVSQAPSIPMFTVDEL
jgi:threonine synthase